MSVVPIDKHKTWMQTAPLLKALTSCFLVQDIPVHPWKPSLLKGEAYMVEAAGTANERRAAEIGVQLSRLL